MKKLIIVTTAPVSLATLTKGQPRYLSQHFDVKLVTSSGEQNEDIAKYEGVELTAIDMTRQITVMQDLRSLWRLFCYMRNQKPDIVYSFTPKGGLLAMIGALMAGVPMRIHNVVGMPLMEATGFKKKLLVFVERLTYSCSTKLLCNSFGLRDYINQQISKKPIIVVGQGSINGVDTEHYHNILSHEVKREIRSGLDIDEDDTVLTFVGRIVKDKGINELVEAFVALKEQYSKLKLLLVGDYEEHLNPIKPENMEQIINRSDIVMVGWQTDIRKFLAVSDIFVLPSYREGLPNSLIEAGSYGIPLVATKINGCNEIVIEGKTGVLVEKKNAESLRDGIKKLLSNEVLYQQIKEQVRESMIERYAQPYVWQSLKEELSLST